MTFKKYSYLFCSVFALNAFDTALASSNQDKQSSFHHIETVNSHISLEGVLQELKENGRLLTYSSRVLKGIAPLTILLENLQNKEDDGFFNELSFLLLYLYSDNEQARALFSDPDYVERIRSHVASDNLLAQNNFGFMYENGFGVARDYEKAAELYQLAVDQGYAIAQNNLAYMYKNGIGLERNHEKAAELYQLAADQGYAIAQNNLGFIYKNGIGIERNYEKAAELYQLAVDQGHAAAQYNLGVIYEKGYGVERNYEKAAELYQLAVDQGYAIAPINLGFMYQNGFGVERNYEKAAELYQSAADLGYAPAQNNLGFMYKNGIGVEKNYEEAFKLFQQVANQGHAPGQVNLASMYANGFGVDRDYGKAAELYQLAANQEDAIAQPQLNYFTLQTDIEDTNNALRDISMDTEVSDRNLFDLWPTFSSDEKNHYISEVILQNRERLFLEIGSTEDYTLEATGDVINRRLLTFYTWHKGDHNMKMVSFSDNMVSFSDNYVSIPTFYDLYSKISQYVYDLLGIEIFLLGDSEQPGFMIKGNLVDDALKDDLITHKYLTTYVTSDGNEYHSIGYYNVERTSAIKDLFSTRYDEVLSVLDKLDGEYNSKQSVTANMPEEQIVKAKTFHQSVRDFLETAKDAIDTYINHGAVFRAKQYEDWKEGR